MNNIEQLRKMHESLFFIPNAWDGGSARILQNDGYQAIATTSAGIAFSKGYQDGEKISFEMLSRTISEILDVIKVPLSVDIERGYSEEPSIVKANFKALLELGVSGFNIEDGNPESRSLDNIDDYLLKIKSVISLKEEGYDFVLNARVDAFLLKLEGDNIIGEVIKRSNLLLEAGAECIYIPGVLSYETIQTLCENINGPINIFVYEGMPSHVELESLGIKRISSGSSILRACLNTISNITIDSMLNHPVDMARASQFFD